MYRLPSVPISYIVSPAISSHLCISYRLPSVPISVYRIACHQFPSLYIVSPAISSHRCVSYRLPSFPISVYRIACHQFPILISYRLPSVPISEYRISCHQFPSLCIVSPAIISHLCVSHRLSSVTISVKSYRLSTRSRHVHE